MPVVFGEIKMFFWYEKAQLAFSERQQQLVNTGNNIISLSPDSESSASVSEQINIGF